MPAKDLLPWGALPCPQHQPDAEWEARDRSRASCLAWWMYFYSVRMVHSGQHLWSQFTPPAVCHTALLTVMWKVFAERSLCARRLPASGGTVMTAILLPWMSTQLNGRNRSFLCRLTNALRGNIRETSGLTRGGNGQGRLLGGVNMAAEPWRTVDGE